MSATKGFGDRLAQARREKAAAEHRDISQKDVAAAIQSSGPSVSRWESGVGVPSDRMLERLARFFAVTPGWLRYGQEPKHAAGGQGNRPEWQETAEKMGLDVPPMQRAEEGKAGKNVAKKRPA